MDAVICWISSPFTCYNRCASFPVGALGGRLDHTLGNLNSLYQNPAEDIVLLGEGNIVRLLREGTTHVRVDIDAEGLHCGVIPLNETVIVSSKGLKWDMGMSSDLLHGLTVNIHR